MDLVFQVSLAATARHAMDGAPGFQRATSLIERLEQMPTSDDRDPYEAGWRHGEAAAKAALAAEVERLRAGLDAAIRCSELALFVIRKQGVMPNSSWDNGFNSDLAKAKAARADNGQLEDERK
jgi:hypothetical protein